MINIYVTDKWAENKFWDKTVTDQNVTKRQVIFLRDKFNIGYYFALFLYLKQKSAWTHSVIGEVTSVGTNLHHIQVCR